MIDVCRENVMELRVYRIQKKVENHYHIYIRYNYNIILYKLFIIII